LGTLWKTFLISAGLVCAWSATARAQAVADSLATEEKRNYLVPIPVIYYTPETKLALGASFAWIYRSNPEDVESRASTLGGIGIYTLKNQVVLGLGLDHYFDRDRQQITAALAYRKFPNDFYGIGNDTPVDDPEEFTDEGAGVNVDYLRTLRGPWRAGFGLMFGNSSITGVEPGDMLDGAAIPGSSGGQVLGAGLMAHYDSRDQVGYPTTGSFGQLAWRQHGEVLGADYAFGQTTLDLRRYFSLGAERVIALRGLGIASGGEVPFQLLPQLGGDQLLRGYFGGRFRERQLVAAQAEYRSRVWKRLGLAAFGAVGQVAHDLDGLGTGRFRSSFGLGLRFLLVAQEGMNLRMDFGFGEDQSAFYLSFGEAF
jgi:outer membrane protein assembly factor BamA